MGARCNLGDNTAIGTVFFKLRQNDVGENVTLPICMANHHGSSGFVTTCLNTEDTKNGGHQPVR